MTSKTYYQRNRKRVLARNAAYYQRNKEAVQAAKRLHRAQNLLRERERERAGYKKNREKVLARNKIWRKNNRDKIRDCERRYHKKNVWVIRIIRKCKVSAAVARQIIATGKVPDHDQYRNHH